MNNSDKIDKNTKNITNKIKIFLVFLVGILCSVIFSHKVYATDSVAMVYGDETNGYVLVFQSDNTQNTSVYGTYVAEYTGFEKTSYAFETGEVDGIETSSVPWFDYATVINKVIFETTISPISTAAWFYNFTSLTEIEGLSYLDTTNVTKMGAMFDNCTSLTSLDLSTFDTTNLIEAGCMFSRCTNLTSLNLSSFDTSNMTEMNAMFQTCSSLTNLDISNFNTENVTDMSYMFNKCSNLTNLDVSNFNTTNVTDMRAMFQSCSNLMNLDISNFDTENVTDMAYMFNNCKTLTNIDVSNFNTANVIDMSYMFNQCNTLTNLDVSNFDTANVIDMSYMFNQCNTLTNLDVNNFDTANVTNMKSTFQECSGLTNINVSNFNTTNVTNMRSMFYNCNNLTSIDVSNFDTTNVVDMAFMFAGYGTDMKLEEIKGINNFNTSNVTSMRAMFQKCSNLTNLDLSNFDTINTTDMAYMFSSCSGLKSLNLSSFNTNNVTNMSYMFSGNSALGYIIFGNDFIWETASGNSNSFSSTGSGWRKIKDSNGAELSDVTSYTGTEIGSLTSSTTPVLAGTWQKVYAVVYGDDINGYTLVFQLGNTPKEYGLYVTEYTGFEGSSYSSTTIPWKDYVSVIKNVVFETNISPISTAYWFYGFKNLINIEGIEKLNTNNVTNMRSMFYNCNLLTDIDISKFDTENVIDMAYMFSNCKALTNLDVSNFNTTNVTDMGYMFMECNNLISMDVNNFDTSNVTNMRSMFYNCNNLTNIDVSNFDTANVTNMAFMFAGYGTDMKLEEIKGINNFNTSNVTDMSSMFQKCSNLTNIDLSNFDTTNVKDMGYMFFGCKNLEKLNLSSFNTINVTRMTYMFSGDSTLGYIIFGNDFIWETASGNSNSFSSTGSGWRKIKDSNGAELSDVISYTGTEIGSLTSSTTPVLAGTWQKVYAVIYGDETNGYTLVFQLGNTPKEYGIYVTEYTGFEGSTYLSTTVPWASYATLINKVVFELDISPLSTAYWFYGFEELTNIEGIEKLNTSNVTDMSSMFYNCTSLESLDLSNFNTTNVISMKEMFYNDSALSYIVFGNDFIWETTSGEDNAFSSTGSGWKKVKDGNGIELTDLTEYTGEKIAALTSLTTPTLAGTWQKLTFENQNKEFYYKIISQNWIIAGASNGTGIYTYEESIEKNSNGEATNYIEISIDGEITIAASTPVGTYTYMVQVTDTGSGATTIATMTISVKYPTLTLDANGGVINGSSIYYPKYGTENVYTAEQSTTIGNIYSPTKTGYTFTGWYTAISDGNQVLTSSNIGTGIEVNGYINSDKQWIMLEDKTLYAQWVSNTYTVKYNGNGATAGSTADSIHTYDVENNLTANGYERIYTVTYNHNYIGSTDTQKIATYTFKNWNTQADGNGVSYEDEASVINLTSTSGATINMYAQWTSASVSYTPTRVGYRFAGWYSEAECTNKVSDGTYTPTSNITLYAKWEIDETQTKDLSYTVEYYKDNIKVDADTQTVETTVQLLQPDTLTVDKKAINTTDKYEGYRLEKTEPTAIPDTIATGSTIKVYYVKRTDLSYTVKYLEKDSNKELATAKTVGNQTFENTVTEQAIDINGYDKVEPTEKSIQIAVSGNEIIFYYTKRKDLSYTVKYLEKDTNKELSRIKTVTNRTYQETITESAIDIEGYDKVDPTEKSIQIAVSENEIVFYYTKRTDLSYTVKYLEKDTNVELATVKTVENQTFENIVTEKAIEINGYDKVEPTEKSIQIAVIGNEIVFYYTKRTDLSYTVKYLEKDTNKELSAIKTVNNRTYQETVTESAIDIEGYDKVEPIEKTIQIAVSGNEIVFYYTKRTNISYIVKYLEKDTNVELSTAKTVGNQIFESTATEQAIDIEGYDKVEPIEKSIQIAVSGNEIIFYYTKRTDLSYTVKYLEQDTNIELSTEKTVTNRTYQKTVTEQAIDINGYDKVDPTEKSIQIAVTGNEIVFYYTKRTDLSYTVKYLEQDSDKELSAIKTVNNRTYQETVTEQAIDINGYDKVVPTEKSIQIAVSGNEIVFYYTKRTDLSYTVKYLEKDTNVELATAKTVGNQIFESTVTEQAIDINGYDKIEPTEKSIQIAVSGNEIIFYYTKRADLSYTVKYLEKDTNVELATEKIVENQIFESTVTEQAINIKGYDKVDPIEKSIQIAVSGNEIIFYYTKRTDLSYTVKYLEQDTNIELSTEKTVTNRTYQKTVTEQAIDINGYDKVDPTEKSIQIAVTGNEIVFYYTKRVDLSYKVNYLLKDNDEDNSNNNVLHEQKMVNNQRFKDEITTRNEVIDIYGYKLDSIDKEILTIETTENVINIYYVIDEAQTKELSYTVEYYKDNIKVDADTQTVETTVQLLQPDTLTVDKKAINTTDKYEGYRLEKTEPTAIPDTIATGSTIKVYYVKRTDLSYTVKYLEKDSNKELATAKTVGNQTFENTVTEQAIDINGYDKVEPTEKSIQIAVSGNEIIFYYTKRKDLIYSVKYLEQDTDTELATAKTVENQIFESTAIEQAIDIEGYDKVDPTEKSIQIAVTGNEIVFYYTKRTDLSYTVKYLEKDTNKELSRIKTVINRIYQETITESAIDIDGYDKVAPTEKSIQMAVDGNEIVFYYTKRTDLSYTVKYLEKDTNKELATVKTVGNQTFESTATEQAIDIEGYDKVEPIEKTIQIAVSGNEIIFYYTKRTDLSYTVKYLEKDTNKELATAKTVGNQTFESTATEQAIDINGYDKVDPIEKSIQIAVSGNEIVFYYTKRTDLSYTVKYLEQDTNTELSASKTVENQTFENIVTEQAIEINGYDKVEPIEKSIQIAVSGNEIIFYYTKRTDLSYTVKYLEQDTNRELATAKTVGNQIFESTATEQAIDIEGYDKVEPIEKTIQIAVSGNEIIFYYTKRTDLSYTVKYLEKDTNKELSAIKTVNNRTYQEIVTEQAINIEGYDKVEPIEKSIQIAVSGNEIVFYYTKRTDLSYTVKYLEQDTNIELSTEKIVNNRTYQETATEQAIDINGYDKVDPTEKSIQIAVTGNEIVFYYTKRVDLSYTVNYLLKDNDEDNSNNTVLHEQKIVKNQRFKDEITTRNEVIDIYGYKLDSIDKEILTIETTENVINIYYVIDEAQTKDLSYTVEYYINGEKQEDDTVVVNQTVQVLKPDTLPIKQELIDDNKYTGYQINKLKEIPETINNGGIVEIHYQNIKFSYKIEYYFNGYIDETLTEEKSAEYLDVIDTYEDKIKEGYKFDEVQNYPLTISKEENDNVIKVYYKTDQTVIKEVTYEILYYKDGVVVDTRTITKEVQILLPNEIAVDKNLINKDKYEDADFIETEPAEIPDYIESGDIISVYYETKTSQVTAKYVDKVTGQTISDDIVQEGKIGENYSLETKEIDGYTLLESPELTGTYTEETQEKVFYYAKNAEIKVKYLEKDTQAILANEETLAGYEGKEYETTSKEIENYELVETVGISSGTMQAGTQEVIYYYAQKTKVTVNHIDVISGEILETETISGIVGNEYTTSSKDFEGYILETEPENATGIMTKEEIIINYYYKHISAGVVEKHIDKISGEILDNTLYEGNEGDEYFTTAKEFENYDLDETTLPGNAEGKMTKELIEVKYYYLRKAQVKVEYLDRNTLEEITPGEIMQGHEGDSYDTTPKEIDEYYLVKSMYPENSNGVMTKEEITVTYYYAKKSAGVIEKHINEKTEEILEEKIYEGLEGDDYETSSKDFEGYDLDISKIPENAEGKMTEELIEVNYYYLRKAQVRVEYIDEINNEIIEQNIITGYEGDSYTTEAKEIKNYILDKEKLPENSTGIMTVIVNEDGTVTSEIVVKYYYKKISAGVLEKHIDVKTNDVLEEKFHSGNVGDSYKIESKKYEEYDLITTKLPENSEGTMTAELIEVEYYYIRKATVRVEYVDNDTGEKISEDTLIEGYEDDEYKTTPKEIKDYTLNKDKLPENAEGTMKVVRSEYFVDEVKAETVVTYYYDKVKKPSENKDDDINNTKPDNKPNDTNNSNTGNNDNNSLNNNQEDNNSNGTTQTIVITSTDNSNTSKTNPTSTASTTQTTKTPMPSTGDIAPIISIGIILIVSLVNIVQIIISKRKKDSK